MLPFQMRHDEFEGEGLMFWKRNQGAEDAAPQAAFIEAVASSEMLREAASYKSRFNEPLTEGAPSPRFTSDELALAAAILTGRRFDPAFAKAFKAGLGAKEGPAEALRQAWRPSSIHTRSEQWSARFSENEDGPNQDESAGEDGEESGPIILNAYFLRDLIQVHSCLAAGAPLPERLQSLRDHVELALADALGTTDFDASYGYLDDKGELVANAYPAVIAISGGYQRGRDPKLIFYGNLDISSLDASINIFIFNALFINGGFGPDGGFEFEDAFIYAYDMKVKSFWLKNVDVSGGEKRLGSVNFDSSSFSGDLKLDGIGASVISLRHVNVEGRLDVDIAEPERLPAPRANRRNKAVAASRTGLSRDLRKKIGDQSVERHIDLSYARVAGLLALSGKNEGAQIYLDHCRCEVFRDPGAKYCEAIHIEGFEYRWLRTKNDDPNYLEDRIKWLDEQPDQCTRGRLFRPQPWDQLSETLKRMGRFKLAYNVQMEKEERIHEALGPDHIARNAGKPISGLWNGVVLPTLSVLAVVAPLLVGLGVQTFAPQGVNVQSSWSLILGLVGSVLLAWLMIQIQTLGQGSQGLPKRSTLIWALAYMARWLTEWGYGLRRLAVASMIIWVFSAGFFQLAYLNGYLRAEGRVAALEDLINTAAGQISYMQSDAAAGAEASGQAIGAIQVVSTPDATPVYGEVCPVAGDASPFYVGEFNGALYALDTFVPVLELGQESDWKPATQSVCADGGHVLLSFAPFMRVLVIAFGWLATSLLLSALTGIIRREQVN